jgi:very-short-patch-repair endonuclease
VSDPPTPPPSLIPSPIVFGPDFPKFKMFLRKGRQVFESSTNQNLYLTPADFTAEGTYPLYKLLDATGLRPPMGLDPMWVKTVEYGNADAVSSIELVDELDFERSSALTLLLNYSPESHRPFHTKYIQSQWRRKSLGFEFAVEQYAARTAPIATWTLGLAMRELLLSFPALIPEVWLAAVGYDKTLDDQAYLAEHPQRVDFVLFSDGRKAVIEIDGPDHYSEWNAALGESIASEEIYTRNLRIERSLRRQGWAIHRFSRYEALNVDAEDFPNLLAELGLRRDYATLTQLTEQVELIESDIPF